MYYIGDEGEASTRLQKLGVQGELVALTWLICYDHSHIAACGLWWERCKIEVGMHIPCDLDSEAYWTRYKICLGRTRLEVAVDTISMYLWWCHDCRGQQHIMHIMHIMLQYSTTLFDLSKEGFINILI